MAAWRREVLGRGPEAGVTPPPKAKGKAKGGAGLPPDDRPFTVGYREFPTTFLPARDGVPQGGIKRSAGAPNSSYFTQWRSLEGAITWDIEVHTPGKYEVAIYYTCAPADVGSQIELSFKGGAARGTVTPGWDPPLVKDHDRVERIAESYLKDFRALKLGAIELAAGRDQLRLRALEKTGTEVMDVRKIGRAHV